MGVNLYISTDDMEFDEIFYGQLGNDKIAGYSKISIQEGETIKKRIGFNPVTLIRFEDKISADYVSNLAKVLVSMDYCAYLDNGDQSQLFMPKPYNLVEEINSLLKKHSKVEELVQ